MHDFLVEISPGREEIYRTRWAMRAAMLKGEITDTARIYHHTAARWIPITEHPEYRRFLAERHRPGWLDPVPAGPGERPEPETRQTNGHGPELTGLLGRVAARLRAAAARLTAPPEPPRRRTQAEVSPEPERDKPAPAKARSKAARHPPPPPPAPPPPSRPPDAPEGQRKGWTFFP